MLHYHEPRAEARYSLSLALSFVSHKQAKLNAVPATWLKGDGHMRAAAPCLQQLYPESLLWQRLGHECKPSEQIHHDKHKQGPVRSNRHVKRLLHPCHLQHC